VNAAPGTSDLVADCAGSGFEFWQPTILGGQGREGTGIGRNRDGCGRPIRADQVDGDLALSETVVRGERLRRMPESKLVRYSKTGTVPANSVTSPR
jgi:hypothetical protein